jgi:ABC-type transporter Mla subunit MlaD
MQAQAQGIDGYGRDINDALGNLAPFAEDTAKLVDILNTQQGAVTRLISNSGVVFGALSERGDQLRSLIDNSNQVFATTAARDRQLQEAFIALPTFEDESRKTVLRLADFARNTDPLVDQLRPAARELSPTLIDLEGLAPDLKKLFVELNPLIDASKKGFPAAQRVLHDLRPLLGQIDPAARQLVPILDWLGLYKRELTAFFANTVAATQGKTPGDNVHYLRTTNPLNPENLAVYPKRLPTNRPNPYAKPGAFTKLAQGLLVYENRHCTGGPSPQVTNLVPAVPDLPVVGDVGDLVPDPNQLISDDLLARIQKFAFAGAGQNVPAPACTKQAPFTFGGETTQYPHVTAGTGR